MRNKREDVIWKEWYLRFFLKAGCHLENLDCYFFKLKKVTNAIDQMIFGVSTNGLFQSKVIIYVPPSNITEGNTGTVQFFSH